MRAMPGGAAALGHPSAQRKGGEGAEPDKRARNRSLQGIIGWLYARTGSRYFETLVVGTMVAVLVFVVPAYTALLVPYFHATGEQYLRFTAAFEVALIVAGVGNFAIMITRHRPLVRWLHGERGEQAAPAAWESAVSAVPVSVAIGLAWACAWCVPPALYVGSVAHLSWFGQLLYIVFLVLLLMGVAIFCYLFIEQALRPVVREIAAELPSDSAARGRSVSLGAILLVLLPAINVFTGSVVAAASTNSLGLEGRLAVTLGVALFVGMTASLVLTLLLRRSLLLRLRTLQLAIGQVDSGDYSARVPHLTGDELDAVGDSFNRMAAGLQEREVLQSALASYVDASLATRMLSEGEILSGRELEVTILFLDIRDFSALADRSSATALVSYLSEFYGLVIPIVRKHGGHANKLLGDGLLAVFGAPTPLEHHADHALQAAVETIEAVQRQYDCELRIGVGLHSGEVVAGTIGGGGKLDYTLIGDAVNVAFRVEELTKETGDPLLITESTRRLLTGDTETLQARGAHRLRGKALETPIYAVGPEREQLG